MKRFAAAVAALATFSAPCLAIDPFVSEVKFVQMSQSGAVTGCMVEFTMGFGDTVYRGGKPTGISGSIGLMINGQKDSVGGFVKIAGLDFENGTTRQFRVANGVLMVAGKHQRSAARTQCERPSNYCAVFDLTSTAEVLRGMAIDKLEVGFNRRDGGMDVMLPAIVPAAEFSKMMDCTQELLSQISTGSPR